MSIVPFGEWTPDQPDLAAGSTVATNVLPSDSSYRPAKAAAAISSAADARIMAMEYGEDPAQNVFVFAANATKIYRYTQGTLTSVSKSGNYTTAAGERWTFCKFGPRMIAANFTHATQSYVMGTSSLFADLNAAAPKARTLATVRDFVVMGDINESSTNYANRVRWSALGDPTNWTIGTSTQSDYQDIFGGGNVQAIVGGEYGLIFMKRSIHRMNYVGSPLIFQFDEIASNRGLAARDAVTKIGNMVFFLDRDGFYMYDGRALQPIGAGKVDRYFWSNCAFGSTDRITCAADPINGLVAWSYISNTDTTGNPDRVIVYNWRTGRWSEFRAAHQLIGDITTIEYTVEQLDTVNANLDNHTISFDSSAFKGGDVLFATAIDHKLATFTGATLAAEIETPEAAFADTRRSVIRSIRPIVDGGTLTMQIGTRNRINDAVVYGSTVAQNAAGFCPFRAEGRYHRAKLYVAAGSTWSEASGLEFDAVAGGMR